MDDFVELKVLNTPYINYFFDNHSKGFVMRDLRTGDFNDASLGPKQMEIFHKEYPHLLLPKPQNTRTSSFFALDNREELSEIENQVFKFFFDNSSAKFIFKNKSTGEENLSATLHKNLMNKLTPEHKLMIQSKLPSVPADPNPIPLLRHNPDALDLPEYSDTGSFRTNSGLDFQNDDSTDFKRPPLVKSTKSSKGFFSAKKNSKDKSTIDNRDDEFDFANIKSESTVKKSSPLIQQAYVDLKKGGTTVQKLNNTGNNSTDSTDKKPKWCEKFSKIFSVTFFFMVVVWIFNLGYSYGKYFTQLKTLSPRLVQFYYIYSAICMFITIVLMGGSILPLPSHWYLIFALFGIGHIVTSTVVLSIVVPKMDKDPSLQVLKNNVKAHVGLDIINGILMVIGALGSHYCRYQCILKQDLLENR